MLAFTVNAFHCLVFADVSKLLKLFCIAGMSAAVGGASSTLAYRRNAFSRGCTLLWQTEQQANNHGYRALSHKSGIMKTGVTRTDNIMEKGSWFEQWTGVNF